MARGYPDFFGSPTHIQYGITTEDDAAGVVVAPGDTDIILTVDKKVILYSAGVQVGNQPGHYNDILRWYFDGSGLGLGSFAAYAIRNMTMMIPGRPFIVRHDPIAGNFLVQLAGPINVGYQFYITYNNTAAGDATVTAFALYADIITG